MENRFAVSHIPTVLLLLPLLPGFLLFIFIF